MRVLLLLAMLVFAAPVAAANDVDVGAFEQLPILDGGRVKPLGSYARMKLEDGHSKRLARILFDPAKAYQDAAIFVQDDDLKRRLGLDMQKDHFTLQELAPGIAATQDDVIALLENPEDDLTQPQKDLLQVHDAVLSTQELLRTFSLLLPLNLEGGKNYLELTGRAEYEEELEHIRLSGIGNDDFKIIPTDWQSDQGWYAPWELINSGKGSPRAMEYLEIWERMARAYQAGDAESWGSATQEALDFIAPDRMCFQTELWYQAIKPYHWVMVLYGLSILLLFLQLPAFTGNAIGLAALFLHIIAIIARVYILDRAPVGTLYESVIFVAAICAGTGLLAGLKTRSMLFPITGQIAALGLLIIAPVMLQQNDSLELLVAVLNSNFWLGVHVLTITIGYGVCILAAVMAHAYLVIRLNGRAVTQLYPLIHKTGLFALLFTAVGTVLGGVWADQSWGRFWGWDPKENGALLIVLWLIWVQHGRLSGHLRELPYVALMALLNIVVAVAWFGVNLLGVGLHSYGFTSGIANGLLIFCLAELTIILALYSVIRMRKA